jgi:hypothetical protein
VRRKVNSGFEEEEEGRRSGREGSACLSFFLSMSRRGMVREGEGELEVCGREGGRLMQSTRKGE